MLLADVQVADLAGRDDDLAALLVGEAQHAVVGQRGAQRLLDVLGRRLGVEVDELRYVVPVQTANGTTYAASIRLASLSVGKIKMNNVDALVARRGTLRENLLGMSFLNRLNSYEFSGEYLTLRKL